MFSRMGKPGTLLHHQIPKLISISVLNHLHLLTFPLMSTRYAIMLANTFSGSYIYRKLQVIYIGPKFISNIVLLKQLWRLISCATLTGLMDAQTAGKSLFLEVFMSVSLEKISIWVNVIMMCQSSLHQL